MAQQSGSRPNPIQDYVTVAERIEKFYQRHENGRIVTHIVEHDAERGFILMRAEIYRSADDALPAATGHAYEFKSEGYVNKTSYVENCETSCVGRGLALMGFEIRRGIASKEEMDKVDRHKQEEQKVDEQIQLIQDLRLDLNKLGVFKNAQDVKDHVKEFTNQKTDNIRTLNVQEKQDYIAALKILIKQKR